MRVDHGAGELLVELVGGAALESPTGGGCLGTDQLVAPLQVWPHDVCARGARVLVQHISPQSSVGGSHLAALLAG